MNSLLRALTVTVAALLGVAGLFARDAHAQAPPPPAILLHVAAEDAAVPAIDERLRARLSALGVAFTLDAVPTVDIARVLDEGAHAACDDAPLAEGWLDGLVPGEATLLLVPCGDDRALARRIALPWGFDEVALAELVYIVDRAVQTLLVSQPVGLPREQARAELARTPLPQAPPPAPARDVAPPVAPGAPALPLAFQVGAFAGAQSWSDDDWILPVGGLFAALERVAGASRLGVTLSAGVRGIARTSTPDARISSGGGDARLWLTLGRSFGRAGLWRLSLGPGLHVEHVEVTPSAASLRNVTPASRTDLDPTIGASLRWDVVPIGSTVVFVAASVDVQPRVPRYTAVVDGASATLIAPWPVRPLLMLGVALDLASR